MLNALEKEYLERQYDMWDLGTKLPYTFFIQNGKVSSYDFEERNCEETIKEFVGEHFHEIWSCCGFRNGNWLHNVSYNRVEDILSQEEEDYNVNVEIANFLYALMVIANESIICPNNRYFIEYCEETNTIEYKVNEDIQTYLEYIKECYEEE